MSVISYIKKSKIRMESSTVNLKIFRGNKNDKEIYWTDFSSDNSHQFDDCTGR